MRREWGRNRTLVLSRPRIPRLPGPDLGLLGMGYGRQRRRLSSIRHRPQHRSRQCRCRLGVLADQALASRAVALRWRYAVDFSFVSSDN